jgi:hypothetical protein
MKHLEEVLIFNKCQPVTKAICNKGFSGNSSVLPRIKFLVGGQESSPQSLTAYSLSRISQKLFSTTNAQVPPLSGRDSSGKPTAAGALANGARICSE